MREKNKNNTNTYFEPVQRTKIPVLLTSPDSPQPPPKKIPQNQPVP
jgi:hypothetical protein